MKLISFMRENSVSCGILTDSGIIDIPSNYPGARPPAGIKGVLERGGESLAELARLEKSATDFIALDTVRLLAPIPRPPKVVALAGNYAEHIKEAGLALGLSDSPRNTTIPRPFLMPPTVVVGPGETIGWPVYSEQIDYELELAIVIGKKCKCIGADAALDHIAGYTIANDVSARSVTFKAGRKNRPWDEFYDWLSGKWHDGFLPMGPYLLTADEIADVQNLDMELKVNGEIRQSANTGSMIYPVADIVSFLSHIMTLEPADCIATGTPAGVAMATGNFLKPGDKMECSIEKLGTLSNTLADMPQRFYQPLAK